MVTDLKNKIYGGVTSVVGNMMPVLRETQFLAKGQLTPGEFVTAGDNLTHKCSTWKWRGCDAKKFDNNFPEDKQFLITERVPCQKRISEVESAANAIQEVELEDDWFEARVPDAGEDGQVVDMDNAMQVVDDIDGAAQQQADDDEVADMDEEVADMDAEMEQMEDPAAATDNIFETEEFKTGAVEENSAVKKVRMYDLSITYDFYHRTPRLWLQGYSEEGDLLTQNEMFQDIMADYARKTVTFESHPKLSGNQLSIHPCNHATVMKKMIDTIQENGGEPRVENSLFFFLKFISSVVPTIEHDFTIELEMD